MYKVFFIVFFLGGLISFCQKSFGQDTTGKINANFLLVEVFGHSSSLFSANYEKILVLPLSSHFCSFRAGIGYSPGITIGSNRHKGVITTPLVFSLLFGKKKNYVQLGIGYTSAFGENWIDSTTTNPTIYQKFESAYILSLGYRYIWKAFTFQIYPLVEWTTNPSSRFSIGGGISLGNSLNW